MTDFSNLTPAQLRAAAEDTRNAITKGRQLLQYVATHHVTLGLQAVADATPRTIDKLDHELDEIVRAFDQKLKS
jgi:hypothetical protein